MFVLLQVYPPEATAEDGSDDCCCLDVIAVNASEAELERFLAGYQFRYAAACRAFAAWDDMRKTGVLSMTACTWSFCADIRSTAA